MKFFDIDKVPDYYKLFKNKKFKNIFEIKNFLNKSEYDFTHFHHIAFMVPKNFSKSKLIDSCDKVCLHNQFKCHLGIIKHQKLDIELIMPLKDSKLLSSFSKNSFIFDHYCLYNFNKVINGIPIIKEAETCLFHGIISF